MILYLKDIESWRLEFKNSFRDTLIFYFNTYTCYIYYVYKFCCKKFWVFSWIPLNQYQARPSMAGCLSDTVAHTTRVGKFREKAQMCNPFWPPRANSLSNNQSDPTAPAGSCTSAPLLFPCSVFYGPLWSGSSDDRRLACLRIFLY